MTTVHYSLVIPVYNEEDNLPEMYRRLCQVMEPLPGMFELILVDDGSRDRSLIQMRKLREQDERVRYISLARNFGHQIAVTAGLQFAKGDCVLILDADLQDPPELIPEMIERWQEGYDVVYAQRTSRRRESWLKRFMAFAFYRILRQLVDVQIPTDTGDFCLMDQRVVTILNAMPERNRYLRGLRSWVGFRQTAVQFQRDPRFAGKPKYTFFKSWLLAIDGIISLSRVPLKLSTYVGLFAASLALIMMLLVLYWRLFEPDSPLIGAALITMAIFFIGGVQLVCIGILGEYIGRIYEEVKGRPLYTVREAAGVVYSPAASKLPVPPLEEPIV
ncbi:MAG: glycosyltransferase family 2 protein [Thainema sp.]